MFKQTDKLRAIPQSSYHRGTILKGTLISEQKFETANQMSKRKLITHFDNYCIREMEIFIVKKMICEIMDERLALIVLLFQFQHSHFSSMYLILFLDIHFGILQEFSMEL